MGETYDGESQSGSAPPASLMRRYERIFRLDFEQIKEDVLKLTLGTGNVVVVESRLQELRQLKKEYFKVRSDILDILSEEEVEDELHANEGLSGVQKFAYLRSSLKGAALKSIEGFEVTEVNYQHAVKVLCQRLGRKRQIVSSLVKSIVTATCKDSEKATSLRELHDLLQNRVRALEAMGFDSTDENVRMLVIPLLEMKMSPELTEKWELHTADIDDVDITVNSIFQFLHNQVLSKEARERTSGASAGNKPVDKQHGLGKQSRYNQGYHTGNKSKEFTASALLGGTRSISCGFCTRSGHEAWDCKEAKKKSVNERWDLAKRNKLCYNCLRVMNFNHSVKSCNSPTCPIDGCGRKHHRLLHNKSQECDKKNVTISGFVAAGPSKTTEVLLQTAQTTVITRDGSRVPVRVLLDPGSQRSYVRKRIVDFLGITGPNELLSIATLGGQTSKTKSMPRIKLSIADIQVEVLAIEEICAKLGPVSQRILSICLKS
ncbi:uncharacterized protein LOC135503456 [Lineus longissimus]|uniref:uncharacterized protein LOC135503456 n=1 Tax=Lineus longissimus TaxID=88925 RepID=UPI00315CC620